MTPQDRTAEHDAFGPWIDVVRTRDDIPRLFRPHDVDPFTARLVLKVPRDIPRRDTDPTMDLYERLLVVDDDALEVLTRDASGFTAQRIPFAELVAIRDGVDLLDGRLALHASDGTAIRIPFNGASSEVVVELTELLIERAGAAGSGAARSYAPRSEPVPPCFDLGTEEAGVAAAYWDLVARDPELRFLSSHPRLPLQPAAGGVVGAFQRVRPMSLAGTIAACSPRELLILTRRDQVLRRRTATLSIDRLHLLRHAITSTTSEPHPRWQGMSIVTIHAGASSFEIVAATNQVESDLLTVCG